MTHVFAVLSYTQARGAVVQSSITAISRFVFLTHLILIQKIKLEMIQRKFLKRILPSL